MDGSAATCTPMGARESRASVCLWARALAQEHIREGESGDAPLQ